MALAPASTKHMFRRLSMQPISKNERQQFQFGHTDSRNEFIVHEEETKPLSDLDIVNINLGGKIFQIDREKLRCIEGSRLSRITKVDSNFSLEKNEFYFDRNPKYFNYILDGFRCGEIHIPQIACPMAFMKELQFWAVDTKHLAPCCKQMLHENLDDVKAKSYLQDQYCNRFCNLDDNRDQYKHCTVWRVKIYRFLTNPKSSLMAKVWSILFHVLLILTIVAYSVGTLSSCRVETEYHKILHFSVGSGAQSTTDEMNEKNSSTNKTGGSSSKINNLITTQPHPVLIYIEGFCMLFFTFEFLLLFIVCPSKKRMLFNIWTLCDMIYLVPIWSVWIISFIDPYFWNTPDRVTGLIVLQSLMVLRVIRLFHLLKYYRGLKLLYLAIKSSLWEISLLLVFVGIATLIYASLIYCVEIAADSDIDSVFKGLWWALITMTTVGYGDIVPSTWLGYIIACMCALTGIVLIGMPVPMIARNFHTYYDFDYTCDHENNINVPDECRPKKKCVVPLNINPKQINTDQTTKSSPVLSARECIFEEDER